MLSKFKNLTECKGLKIRRGMLEDEFSLKKKKMLMEVVEENKRLVAFLLLG
jgi:hypothetical protein